VRKILASLFVIAALLGVGVFATGAYFQVVQPGPAFDIETGTADLFVQPVGGNLGDLDKVGPGYDRYTCISILNDGEFALNVTLSLAFPDGNAALEQAMYASLNPTNSSCTGYGTDYTLDQYIGNPQVLATGLTPGATAYVVLRLHWNETGTDQSTLMGGGANWLRIVGTITGQTLP